jgi:hypothetical protein
MQVEPLGERRAWVDGDRVDLDRGVAGEFDGVSGAEVESTVEDRGPRRPLESAVSIGIRDRYVGDTITVGVEREEPRG